MNEDRCEICGVPGVAPKCKNCEEAAAAINATYNTVACCWNCGHRGYARARDSSLGHCDLSNIKNVPPDGHCSRHENRRSHAPE